MEGGMNPALQLFLTVALPINLTIVVGMWITNRRLSELSDILTAFQDDMGRRFEEIAAVLDRASEHLG
jgi:hypothetical protein